MIADLQPGDVVIAEKIDRISRLPLPEAEKQISATAEREVAEMGLPQPGEEQVLQISLSRDKIAAVATYNTGFGYSITARSNQDDVSYRWRRISGDPRIYTKTQEGATVEVVIPNNVEGVSTRFEVIAESLSGEDKKIIEVQALTPEVKITGPTEISTHESSQLKALANFDQATYDWSLKHNGQIVSGGIDASGQIAKTCQLVITLLRCLPEVTKADARDRQNTPLR